MRVVLLRTKTKNDTLQKKKEKQMGKKHKHLFEQIISFDNILKAYDKAAKGNRNTIKHLVFQEHLYTNLTLLQKRLVNGTYKHGDYECFKVFEPKERLISALPFRDRVVQHALHNHIAPIFNKVFYNCSYACQPNKGTHKGVIDTQAAIRRLAKNGEVYYLKMDFSKYFHNIDKAVLFREIEKKITDKRVLKILQEFDGKEGKGIPIGNLMSQLYANIYGHIFDRFIKTKLKMRHYFRYMDDTVILSNDKEELRRVFKILKRFSSLFLKMRFSKWYIDKVNVKPLNFLGYRITESYKLIRKQSVLSAKRKIYKYTKAKDTLSLRRFIASWGGHIQWSDSHNLKIHIVKEIICSSESRMSVRDKISSCCRLKIKKSLKDILKEQLTKKETSQSTQ